MRIYNKLEVTVCLLSTLGMVVEGVLMSKRIGGISFGMTIGIFYLLHLLLFLELSKIFSTSRPLHFLFISPVPCIIDFFSSFFLP